jgi:hypothetical protein
VDRRPQRTGRTVPGSGCDEGGENDMKKLIIMALLIGGAYYWYTHKGPGQSLGIAPTAPLGQVQALDQHLTKMGLQKRPNVTIPVPDLNQEVVGTEYLDMAQVEKSGGFKESVALVTDDKGNLKTVVDMYILPPEMGAWRPTTVSTFLLGYWGKLGGGELQFTARTVGSNATVYGMAIFQRQQQVATFSNGPVSGIWVKETPMGYVTLSLQ